MSKFQYNEIEYAKYILENGFYSRYHKYELKVLAKYWKYIGIKPKQRKELLYEFCQKHIIDFEREIHYKLINSVLVYSSKKTSVPIVIDNVEIYEHEMEFLNNLPVQEYIKKVVFTILLEKKIRNKIQVFYNPDSEDEMSSFINYNKNLKKIIKSKSGIQAKYDIDFVLNDMKQLDLIAVLDRGLLKLNFIDQLNEQKSEILLSVKKFNHFGYYYDLITGDKKIAFCEECDEIIKRRANNQTRCKECNESYRRDYWAEKKREQRKNVHIQKRSFNIEN